MKNSGIIHILKERIIILEEKINYDPRPTICPLCKGNVIYGDMRSFGLKPYQSGKCYICSTCGAFVGTHQKQPMDALGMLGHGDVRKLRAICHEEFDRHWMSTSAKNRLYYKLSLDMGIDYEQCHFGYMNKENLLKALNIMKGWGDLYYR